MKTFLETTAKKNKVSRLKGVWIDEREEEEGERRQKTHLESINHADQIRRRERLVIPAHPQTWH